MGTCMPFSIAAKLIYPEKTVVAVVGDSAFGFSAMEIETAVRYKINYVIIILNNNGIFYGEEDLDENANALTIAPTTLSPSFHYEKMAEMMNKKGYFVKTHAELEKALTEAFEKKNQFCIINVKIDPAGSKKPQEFAWLSKEAPKL